MKSSVKATIVTVAVVVVLLVAVLVLVFVSQSNGSQPNSAEVVRDDSHVLDDGGDGAVTVVEFLDFECEVCGAFYPIVEEVRKQFDGEITYVVRYFPLPGHLNSTNAALAAEAAAQQGRFEDMYHRLFETQAEWGEAQDSRAGVFRGFAEEMGLDMAVYDADVASPATAARVQKDFDEALALGVSSTPTFFVEGEKVDLQGWRDLLDAVQNAVDSRP